MLNRDVLTRLDQLEAKIDRIEAAIVGREAQPPAVRELLDEIDHKRDQLDALSAQSLHMVELLREARLEVERWKYGGGDQTPTA